MRGDETLDLVVVGVDLLIDNLARYPPDLQTLFHDPNSLPAPMLELYDVFGKAKKRWLGDRKYWYLNIIVRNPERSDRGESLFLGLCRRAFIVAGHL